MNTQEENDTKSAMMKLEIVFCLFFTISGLNASFDIEISQNQVAIKNDTFSPAKTVIDCNSTSQEHQYCCWVTPQLKGCDCDEKDCPLGTIHILRKQKMAILYQFYLFCPPY